MIKQLTVLLIALGCCSVLRAQPELTKTVVASGGGNFANGGLTLSSTVAELTMVKTFTAGTADLFQGFQNSARLVEWVNVNPVAHSELTLVLYPNPASAFLNLEMGERNSGKLLIALSDMLGRTVHFVAITELQNKVTLDVGDLSSGTYALIIRDSENNYVTCGFMGQLPCVVRGLCKKGDFILTSGLNDGTAIAVSPADLKLEHLNRIVGRAWEVQSNEIYGLVIVAIGLKTNEWV